MQHRQPDPRAARLRTLAKAGATALMVVAAPAALIAVAAPAALIAATAPAAAQPAPSAGPTAGDEPYIFPRRDVTVTYRSAAAPGQGAPTMQTLRVSATLGRQRVDAPGGGMSMITDSVGRTTTIVDNAKRGFVVLPAPAGTSDMRDRRAATGYQRAGSEVVAGLPCTLWSTHDPRGQPIEVCLTDDGVLLQARAGTQVLAEAVHVDFAPLPRSVFEPPPGYTKLPPPAPPPAQPPQ